MDEKTNITVLAEAGLRQLKQMKGILDRAEIEAAIIRPPLAGNT